MSVFKTEIEDLVGAVGDDTFLNDSIVSTAKEIIKALPPNKVFSVSETSAEITSQAYDIGEAKVLKVQRETGSNGVFSNCTEVSAEYEDKVQDSGSMFYPSVTNPVYLFKNGNVWVYPAPENSPNSMKVTTILYPTTIDCTTASVGGSALATFPKEYQNLVVVGASVKALQYLMARVKDNFSGINPTFVAPTMASVGSLTLLSAPSVPVLQSTTISFSQTAPSYTKPVFSEPTFPTISAMDLPSVPTVPVDPFFTTPDIAEGTVGSLGTAPTYAKPVQSFDTGQLETFLETDEDPELAQIQIGRLSQELGQYQADIQNELNEFNKENAIYQTTVQKAVQDAQIKAQENQGDANLKLSKEQQEYGAKMSKYQNDVSNYQAQVNKEVQRWTSEEFNKKLQEWQTKYNNRLQQYSSDIQNALNVFSKENVEYQAQLQVSIQNAQQEGSDDSQKLQLYNTEVTSYQAQTSAIVQKWMQEEWTQNYEKYSSDYARTVEKYNADVQKYGADLQKYNSEYQWYQDQYTRLSTDYKEQLQIIMAN